MPYLLKENSRHGHVGRDKARRFLRELERAGYLTRSRTRSPDGCWVWDNVFTPVPTIDGSATDGSSVAGSSVGDGPVDIHQTSTTTNGLKSDSTNQQPCPRGTIGANTVVGPSNEIRFPEILSGKHLASARRLINACPPELRQDVLHEVDAMHQQGLIRKARLGSCIAWSTAPRRARLLRATRIPVSGSHTTRCGCLCQNVAHRGQRQVPSLFQQSPKKPSHGCVRC